MADNYLQLDVGDQLHLHRGTMKEPEEELDRKHFVRIHRCVMVAVDRIVSIHTHAFGNYVVELRGRVRLRSSRQYADRVRALLR